ncbi:hypothetical protein ACROYT_G024865 [Oculina patagonica]
MHPLLGKTLLRVTLYYAYGLFVAWIFTLIEKTEESVHDKAGNMLKELRAEIDLKYNMTDNDFESFVRKAAAAMEMDRELDWTFLNSCGFSFAAITTIGFGNITPKTQLGQGITIVVCIIGIPITMLALKTSGELLATCIRFLIVKTETVLLKRAEPKHVKMKTFLAASTLMVVLNILASVSSTFLESWSFVEGVYAWFITFTTIGFGDFVQMESMVREVDHGETSKGYLLLYGILCSMPYVIGLSLTSCLLTCLVDSIDHIRDFRDRIVRYWPNTMTSVFRRLLCCKLSNYDVKGEDNQEYCSSQQMS